MQLVTGKNGQIADQRLACVFDTDGGRNECRRLGSCLGEQRLTRTNEVRRQLVDGSEEQSDEFGPLTIAQTTEQFIWRPTGRRHVDGRASTSGDTDARAGVGRWTVINRNSIKIDNIVTGVSLDIVSSVDINRAVVNIVFVFGDDDGFGRCIRFGDHAHLIVKALVERALVEGAHVEEIHVEDD